jgi:hypothetical protein
MLRRLILQRRSFQIKNIHPLLLSGISPTFAGLSQSEGQIIYALLTRAPLYSVLLPFTFDLHVLGMPPAFVLSQDQTLKF